ncbi:MAG: family 43 glycosylhydrolase [Lachnospiraceae bacterium]
MKYYCNPLNLEYRYQYVKNAESKEYAVFREAADPSLVLFKDMYYLFPSMSAGFFTSDDLRSWEFHEFLQDMPIYAYAPDVRVAGEYLYFTASKENETWSFFRTRDPLTEPFEELKGDFSFWDPNLFVDDDGRRYLYWGCSNAEPICVVELDPETMKPLAEPIKLFNTNVEKYGYERSGEDHIPEKSEEEIWQQVDTMISSMPEEEKSKCPEEHLRGILYGYMGNNPCLEGPWVTKHNGKYYLQYAIPGTHNNVYGDGVCVSNSPLGPFEPCQNNPYSYKPGGFITGAGHGSTLADKNGDYWHIASMRICCNYKFERRLGLWKAGFDKDGELYCDQRYADWPTAIEQAAFSDPEWMLLSYGKKVTVSSGNGAKNVTDEDIRTWWISGSDQPGEWVEVDLGAEYDVRAIQVNFADNLIEKQLPEDAEPVRVTYEERYIETEKQATRWLLEGSSDGAEYFVIEDKREAKTDYAHDLIVREDGLMARYIRVTIESIPYHLNPCVSGLRIWGKGDGEPPKEAEDVSVSFEGDLDMTMSCNIENTIGINILWGYEEDKLYHSCMVYGESHKHIGALIKDQSLFVRVDTFNENGITEGTVLKVREGKYN